MQPRASEAAQAGPSARQSTGAVRPSSAAAQDAGAIAGQRPTRRQLVSILWRHSAALALATPASLALPQVAAAAALALTPAQPGGPPPPSSSGRGGGGGRGDGGRGAAATAPNELMQLAAGSKPIVLTLASFAVTRKAYGKIVRRFVRDYEEATGRVVRFRLTFGGSGTQARAIIDGLPVDIAALALPLDIQKISDAGLIDPGWASRFPNRSSVCESVVSIVTRRGNPKGINGWEDLQRDDIEIVVANPKTAGVARWIFLGLWGHAMGRGQAAAIRYVTRVFDNVEVMPRDAREASDVFYSQGFGDVLLTYENEAVFTNLVVSPNDPLPFISPDNNVRITCPVALVDRNLASAPPEAREAAEAFARHLFTPAAQREFTACGFRSALREVAADSGRSSVRKVWDVEKRLGDWITVQKKFFDEGGILSLMMADVSQRKLQQRLAARRR